MKYKVFYNPDCQMYGVQKQANGFWQQVLPPRGAGARHGKSAYTYYKAVAERWSRQLNSERGDS